MIKNKKIKFLTREEEAKLMVLAQGGNIKARDTVVLNSVPFAKSIAKKYLNQGVNYDDLVAAAITGVVIAVDKYDTDSGNRFSTYAQWHIKAEIMEELAHTSRITAVPRNFSSLISNVLKTKNKMEDQGYTVSVSDLSEKLGVSVKLVKSALAVQSTHSSLDKNIGDEDGTTFLDTIKGQFITDYETDQSSIRKFIVENVVTALDPHEQIIILQHYGIGEPSVSIKELSKQLQITENKVISIKKRAISKMRGVPGLKHEYVTNFK